MTVDHRCSLLPSGHSDVDQMASREKSTITRSPAYVYVRPHVYHQHWNWRSCIFKAIVKSILKSGLVLACEDSHEESLNERSGRSPNTTLQFT